MRKILGIVFTISIFGGCASQYKASEEMKEILQNMDKQKAMKVFHKALDKSDKSVNVCRLGVETDEPGTLTPTPYGFTLNAWRKGKEIGKETINGIRYVRYEKNFYNHQFHLDSISKIRIMDAYCPKMEDYIDLYIEYDEFVMTVSFTKEMEPQFMAALKVWAPNISPKIGVGF